MDNNQTSQGSTKYAAEFLGKLFLLRDEESLKKFVKHPQKYASAAAALPTSARFAFVGPRLSGVTTQAAKCAELYGLRALVLDEEVQRQAMHASKLGTMLLADLGDQRAHAELHGTTAKKPSLSKRPTGPFALSQRMTAAAAAAAVLSAQTCSDNSHTNGALAAAEQVLQRLERLPGQDASMSSEVVDVPVEPLEGMSARPLLGCISATENSQELAAGYLMAYQPMSSFGEISYGLV